jgi:hypothetical protein
MGLLNFGGKKRKQAKGFGNSQPGKSRKNRRTFVLEKIVTPSAGVGGWLDDLHTLHQLLSSLPLPNLHLPNLLADSGVCPIDPSAPTNNLPPLIDFDPLGLYDNGIATQPPDNIVGAFETLPIAVIPIDPQPPNVNDPNAIRQLLDFPVASQPLVGTIDTGVNANSPYFNYANIEQGRDYVGGDNNPLLQAGEGSEHGTFMLGIIDAINKKAPKWVGRAIDSGKWADSLVEFVDAAKASGQKNAIANLSLDLTQKDSDGSVTTRYELTPKERSAIEYARQNGVLLVVAAGNDGGVMSVLGQASQEFDNIITVGSADGNNRADYSSFGRGLDIVAEGGTSDNPELSTVGDGVGTMAGTSVATAKVAGATSLVWAANPDLSYRQVIEILEKTARDLGAPGRDDETGFGFLNTLAAVDLAKKTTPEVYQPTPWYAPETWSGEGKVTPEERAAKGGNSIATATAQVSANFSDIDRVDSNQPEKYYQFPVNEPGYITWNLTSLNPVVGFPTRPRVDIIKADGKPASHAFSQGVSTKSSAIGEGQTSFSDGDFYAPGTYYLKVSGGAFASFKDYRISTQFTADRVSSFAGSVQYRTQPSKPFDSSQSAAFLGPTVSELKNLSGQVTHNSTDFSNRVAKYGFEVNESGKFKINLKSPNGLAELRINKFIGSEDTRIPISGRSFSANSDGWLELDLNKGRYEIEVRTPSDWWQEPDWNSTQQTLVRPYTLNATFTPNAPQPGQGKVPVSAGAFDKTVVSNGVVNHYYANGYLTLQPSGQATWYSYGGIGVTKSSAVPIPDELPKDYAGNLPNKARNIGTLTGTQTFHDVIDKNDRFDYYKFNLTNESKVDFVLSGKMGNTGLYLLQNRDLNSNNSTHIDIISGTTPGVVPEFSETLKPGTYYVLVHKPEGYDGDEYDLKLSAVPLDYAGNILDNARIIPVDSTTKVFKDFVGQTDGDDYYRFDLQEKRQVIMTLDGFSAGASVDLLKKVPSNGQLSQLARFDNGTDVKFMDGVLDAGTYYVRVAPNSTGANTNYNFKFSALKLASGSINSYIIPINPEPSIPQWQKDIDNTYQSTKNLLGNPTTGYWSAADSPTGRKGYGQNYEYGSVYWTPQSGAIALWHDFANIYHNSENKGSNGELGFPIEGKEDWEGGQRIKFENGYIYWTEKEGARAFKNGEFPWEKSIDAEYADHQGLLGNPTTGYWQAADSQNGTKGYGRSYDDGHVFWTAKYGAIAVTSEFANIYHNSEINEGSNGWLGFPTEKKRDWQGGQRIDFEGGYIYWTPQSGAKAYRFNESPSLDKTVGYDGTNPHSTYVDTFNRNGGSSALGSPTGNVHPSGNGYLQEFSGGSEGSGAIMKSNANDYSFWVGDDFWLKYKDAVEAQRYLGYPTSDRFVNENGWPTQNFQNGKIEQKDGTFYVYVEKETSSNPDPSPTPVNKPQIINRNAESGTGKLIQGLNFRNYPWIDSSSLIQGMPVGTNFTILEKVTTTADPNLRHSNWYRVRLNDGREGYFWAGEEFIQKVAASGSSVGQIGYVGIGVSPIKEGELGYVGIGITPINEIPTQGELTDWIKKFLSSVESSFIASLPDPDAENSFLKQFKSSLIKQVETEVRKTLDLTVERFRHLPVYAQFDKLGEDLGKRLSIFQNVTKAIDEALEQLKNAVLPALKTIREGASDIATKLLYYAAELKNIGSADPFSGLKEAFSVGIQFDDFLRNPSQNLNSLKSLVKKAPNLFKKLPYADVVSFFMFDLPDIQEALNKPKTKDVFEEIAGIAGSTLGGAFFGGLLGGGTLNPIVAVLAAILGGVAGELLGKFIYNMFLKPIGESLAWYLGDWLNQGAKALDNYEKYAKATINGKKREDWGFEEYKAALYLAFFGTVEVNAAEISQYEAGRLWRDTFGNEYDYLLSPEALTYLP